MPSIAAKRGLTRTGNRWRLVAGVTLFLLGTFLVGLGAAGAVQNSSTRTGVLIAGVAVLGCLLGLLAVLSRQQRERGVAATGAAVGLAGLLLFWALPSGEVGAIAYLVAVGGLYGFVLGVVVVLAAMLTAVTTKSARRGRKGPSQSIAWTRSNHGTDSGDAAVAGATTGEYATFSSDDR